MNELPPRVRSFLTICVPFLRTPLKKKCVPLTSKSVYPQRGTHNFINVRILKTLASSAADQALSIPGTRKTLQVLSCKVYGGDSWTRTNGLAALRLLSQVRNRRTAALERRLYLLLTTLPPRFIPHCGRCGSAPHDVNALTSFAIIDSESNNS